MEPDIFKMDGSPVLTKEQKSVLAATDLITGILARENFTISQVYEVLRNVETKSR